MAIKYFANFPFISYTLNPIDTTTPDIVTNVFRRVAFLRNLKGDSRIYYPYNIKDGDTPEILAYKLYGSADYYWVVTLFNNILDPVEDWPKTPNLFTRYLQQKYGSIPNAHNTIHHYTKIVTKVNSGGETNSSTYIIDKPTYDALTSVVPEVYTAQDGSTVSVTTTRQVVSVYDYEMTENEAKRSILLLKEQYLPQVRSELDTLVQ